MERKHLFGIHWTKRVSDLNALCKVQIKRSNCIHTKPQLGIFLANVNGEQSKGVRQMTHHMLVEIILKL